MENFIDALPGFPEIIRYDGEGRFWIALGAEMNESWELVFRYPTLRKMVLISGKLADFFHHLIKGSGILAVSTDGEPLALYKDPKLSLTTGRLKIGRDLYYGSLVNSFLSRIPLDEDVAKKK